MDSWLIELPVSARGFEARLHGNNLTGGSYAMCKWQVASGKWQVEELENFQILGWVAKGKREFDRTTSG